MLSCEILSELKENDRLLRVCIINSTRKEELFKSIFSASNFAGSRRRFLC